MRLKRADTSALAAKPSTNGRNSIIQRISIPWEIEGQSLPINGKEKLLIPYGKIKDDA